MPRVQYCKTEIKTAFLNTEFGYNYACKLFGQEVIDSLPLITRGQRKGQRRGCLHWEKAIEGGWMHGVGVVRPGLLRAWISNYFDNRQEDLIRAMWLGREQELRGEVSVLGDGTKTAAQKYTERAAQHHQETEIETYTNMRDQALMELDGILEVIDMFPADDPGRKFALSNVVTWNAMKIRTIMAACDQLDRLAKK